MSKLLPPLHLATGKDELSPNIHYIEVKRGIATATNGQIIVQVNLAETSQLSDEIIKALDGKLIHRDVWNAISDAEEIEVDDESIHFTKGGIIADVSTETAHKFPDYQSIVKKIASAKFEKRSFLAFNPQFVVTAQKIFKSNLVLRFYEDQNMVVFFPANSNVGFMAVVPMELSAEDAVLDFSKF